MTEANEKIRHWYYLEKRFCKIKDMRMVDLTLRRVDGVIHASVQRRYT